MIRVPLIPVGSGQRRVTLPDDLQFAPIQEEGVRSPCPPREGKSLGSLAHSASRQNLGGVRGFLANKSSLVRCCDREKTWLFSRLRSRYPQAYRPKRRCRGQKTGKCCGLRDEPTLTSPHASFALGLLSSGPQGGGATQCLGLSTCLAQTIVTKVQEWLRSLTKMACSPQLKQVT